MITGQRVYSSKKGEEEEEILVITVSRLVYTVQQACGHCILYVMA
jgi:hypothetical protein